MAEINEKPKRIQRALSIRQPWAHAILHLGKDIENRDWRTNFRGAVAVHASLGMTRAEWLDAAAFILPLGFLIPSEGQLERGAIVGLVDIIDCVSDSHSDWFQGDCGFVLKNPRPLVKPIYCKGALGVWNVPPEIEKQILDQLENNANS
jgi:hypothetical protein